MQPDDWDANVTAGNTADATNGVTVSNVATPTMTSATYDASTGILVVTGTGFLKLSGASNDIDVSKLSITGDSTAYTLTTGSVEITSGTNFSVTLNGTDKSALGSRINQNGTSSLGAVTYNLAGAEDWAAGAAAAVVVADLTGNGITASNVLSPPSVSTSVGTTAFTEGNNTTSTPVAVDTGLTVSDPDSATLPSGTVSITGNFQSGQDSLAFTNNPATMGNISGSYNAGTGILTLTSAGATATLAQWQAALRSVTYTDSSDTPNTSTRTISFTLNDGNSDSSVTTKSVSVASVNDTPLATASGGATAFTESNNGAPVPVVIDSGITVSDADNATLASGTVSITGNFQLGQDVLGFTNNPATMGNISGSYNSGTGVLTFTSAGATATVAQWQAALRVVTFTPNVQTPSTATRTISFAVSDGTATSSSTTKSVTVALVDDTPIGTASGGTTAFTEGNNATSTPVVVDSGFSASDEDSATLASATVAITGNFHSSEDALAFTNNPATMGNISGSYNAGTGVLTLTSAGATATVAQWQAALRSVTYTDSSDTPNTSTRTISFTLNDGNSDSSATTKSVSVASVNDTPLATASGGTTAFTEGNNVTSAPVAIDSGLTLSDVDTATFTSATVSITGNFQSGEDVLAFTNNLATMGNIAAVYNAGTGVLTLTSSGATATIAQWQAALRAVTYTNSSDTPNISTRTISFTVNDGSTSSSATTKSVSVASVNDDPTNILLSSNAVNQSAGVNAAVGTLSSVDADSVSFTYSLVSGVGSTDNASFNLSGAALRANDSSAMAPGAYSIRIRTADNLSGIFDKVFSITVLDNIAPAAPSTPGLITASDSGISSTDNVTNVTTPTFTGTAEANSTVQLFRGGVTSLGTTTADGSGNWSLTVGTPLSAGTYSITAKATDAGSNTSVASSALSITIDTTVPTAPIFVSITNDTGISATDQITSDPTLMFSGTAEANSTVTVTLVGLGSLGTTTTDGAGNWVFDYTGTTLSAGVHVFRATAADAAGNISTTSLDFIVTVDLASPAQVTIASISTDTGTSATDGITTDQTLIFNGTADPGATVTLNRTGIGALGTTVANGSGAWTFNYTGTTLPEGSYLFTATSADLAGNVSVVSASFPVTIDLTAPVAPSITGITNDTGTSSTDQITTDGTLILSGTAEANSTVTVIRTGVGVIGTTTADGAGVWSFDYTATTLPIGSHVFTATATDLAGNVSPASTSFTVVVQAGPTVSTQPVGGTYSVGDTITLSVVPAGAAPFTYQWYLDGSALTDTSTRSGSTAATLTETGVTASGFSGTYTVVVTNLSGSATSAGAIVVVNKLSQTITFAQPVAPIAGAPLGLNATATSGLPVAFTVLSGPATVVNGNQLLASQGGVITVRASQAGDVTYSLAADVDRTVTAVVTAPQITLQPVGGSVAEGGTFTLSASAAGVGLTYQWMFNGIPISGATQASLVLTAAASNQQGSYALTVTNVSGSVTTTAVDLTVLVANRLVNLSSRLRAGTGNKTFISGFIISGDAAKSVVIRGVGPGLVQFGVPGVLAHPTLQLYHDGAKIAEAAEWGQQSNVVDLTATMQRLGMFALDTSDSAMLATLQPGAYTAMINGMNGETGVSLVEVYDASTASGRLINISTRGDVGRGPDVLIAGFIIAGTTPKKLLIRAVGPGLTAYGVDGILVNPALRLFDGGGVKIADNDDWEDTDGGAAVSTFTLATGAFPLAHAAKDAAMAVTLPPGAYTAHGYGKDDGTGVALVEVYEVP